jgi:putative glutamine amidotransferase
MRRPLVGVTTSITTSRTAGSSSRPERAYVNSVYVSAVQQAGATPLLLPPQLDEASRAALLERLEGVLLTGGGDIDPARFGEPAHPTVSEVSAARDRLEIALVGHAIHHDLPILAVCRGLQVLNVALGGSLFQDVGTDPGTPVAHSQKAPRHVPTHGVKVAPGSRLAGVLGVDALSVNSLHHQAIKALGRGLRAVAAAEDGIVEGAELEDETRFVLGVQWHPEEMVAESEPARQLFRAFVDAAARRSARPGH